MKNTILKIILFLGIFTLSQKIYSGDANFNSYFGARTLALNGMYIAGVDGLTANINNPSSVAFLPGAGFDLAFFAKIGEYTYRNPDGGEYKSYREENPRVAIGAYWGFTDNIAMSLGYLPVMDYRVDWPFAMLLGDDLNQVILTFDMFNNVKVDAFSFDVAYAFNSFALGVALNVYHISHQMAFPISTPEWSTESILRGAYQFNYDQDAWTYGVSIGVSWNLSENLKLGALLRSGYQGELTGTAQSNLFRDIALADTTFTGTLPLGEVEMKSKIEFPWVTGMGLIYEANDQLRLNVDLQYNLWGGVQNEMKVEFNNQVWNNGLAEGDSVTGIQAGTIQMPAENNLEIGIGIEYLSSQDLILRAGYKFSQTPNKSETYQLAFPTVSQHWISAGIGFVEGNYQIDLTAVYAFGIAEKVNQTENKHWYGEYDGQTFIPAISILYRF